jgi:hypothetical protein
MKKLIMSALLLALGFGMTATAISIDNAIYCDKDNHDDEDDHG